MTGDGFRTRWRIAMVGALLLGSLAAWAQPPTPGGMLRVAVDADVPGLDPHRLAGAAALRLLGNLFNSLLTLDAEGNAMPDLAESWDILEDGQVYVFHLRRGVTFHDGTACDAEAVRWNYRRLMPADEPTLHAPVERLVEAVDALDTHTVRFTLTRLRRPLVPVLAAFFARVVQRSPAAYQRWGAQEVRWHPVGTGPYQLARWEPGHRLVFEKNPHYFKPGLPYLDRLDWRIIPAGVTRVAALRAGEVEFAHAVPHAHVARLAGDPQMQVYRGRETRAGPNPPNHQDGQVNALIYRLREAATGEAYRQAGNDLQRHVTEHMLYPGVTSVPLIQAARASVRGYAYGDPIRFETAWLDNP